MSDEPAWGEHHIEQLLLETMAPGEKPQGYDDRMTFVGALSLAIRLGDDGKLFLQALSAKYPDGVKKYFQKAQLMAKKPIPE